MSEGVILDFMVMVIFVLSYVQANSWYKNLDKLIKYTNMRQVNGSKYHLLYSTPSCYLKAVHESNKVSSD